MSDKNNTVFFFSFGFIFLFSFFGVFFNEQAARIFSSIEFFLINYFGWFYFVMVVLFLLFVLCLGLSRFGHIKLGPDDCQPDYDYLSWFAMLFSAGMGIGLLFFGVAEPITHFSASSSVMGNATDPVSQAMLLTFFHWGLQAWAIYIVVGLSLAYFSFRHGLPLTIRSSLYPIIGDHIHGPIGHAVDISAVIGIMFGIATSLGLGVMQINAGLNYLFDTPVSISVQISLIAIITFMATVSVVKGIDSGIRRLSQLNLILSLCLLLFIFFAGSSLTLLISLTQNIGTYLFNVAQLNFTLYLNESNEWLGDWTLFYWAWWISWSPFVGMFIARISRGRTIREFVIGVLLVPTVFTFVWFTFFGNTALTFAMMENGGSIVGAVEQNMPTAIFVFLDMLPWPTLMSVVAVLLVITFFVTSSDSGSLVIDIIASGGNLNPPIWQRIFWAMSEGTVATVLLLAGSLGAIQTAAISSALPFAFIMLLMCYGLFKALRQETISKNIKGLPSQ